MFATPEEGPADLPLPSSLAQYTPPLQPGDAALREAGDVWLDRIEQALAAHKPGALRVRARRGVCQ
ncbi:MAG: hypothetical protein ACLPJJ_05440 [Acidocella sp.]|uniref:hypothetical protein n=1 Tax=Acidocella sp. TaxID=50710 RepID=UPI003FBABA18